MTLKEKALKIFPVLVGSVIVCVSIYNLYVTLYKQPNEVASCGETTDAFVAVFVDVAKSKLMELCAHNVGYDIDLNPYTDSYSDYIQYVDTNVDTKSKDFIYACMGDLLNTNPYDVNYSAEILSSNKISDNSLMCKVKFYFTIKVNKEYFYDNIAQYTATKEDGVFRISNYSVIK